MSTETDQATTSTTTTPALDRQRHTKFLLHMLNILPTPYSGQDSNRLTLLYFVVGALDVLGQLDKVDRQLIIDFVYALQVVPDATESNIDNCGFRGGTFFGAPFGEPPTGHPHDQSHLAMTYTGLAILAICGDDFSRVNRKAIVKAMRGLQQPDGSFSPVPGGSENDMRFVYCAAVISAMLDDFDGLDIDKAVEYILNSQSYDSALGQGPGQESHGGSTYCAVAALHLLGKLELLPHKEKLLQWCVERQVSGFQGRINKPADSCYAFWVGATLELLDGYQLVDYPLVRAFLMSCQHSVGGFSKLPDHFPDVLHTYMSLCGMSLGGEPGLERIDPAFGFSQRAANFIREQIHPRLRSQQQQS